jgi:magnesium-transporting ATPase (P-type)
VDLWYYQLPSSRPQTAPRGSQVLTILICVCIGVPLPLSPLIVLIVNVVVDGVPTLSLSLEPVDPATMQRPPRDPKEHILVQRSWISVTTHTVALVAAMLTAFFVGLYWHAGREFLADDIDRLTSCTHLVAFDAGDWRTEWVQAPDLATCIKYGPAKARTMLFAVTVLVFSETLRALTVRTDRFFLYPGFLDNHVLDVSIVFSSLVASCPSLTTSSGCGGSSGPPGSSSSRSPSPSSSSTRSPRCSSTPQRRARGASNS